MVIGFDGCSWKTLYAFFLFCVKTKQNIYVFYTLIYAQLYFISAQWLILIRCFHVKTYMRVFCRIRRSQISDCLCLLYFSRILLHSFVWYVKCHPIERVRFIVYTQPWRLCLGAQVQARHIKYILCRFLVFFFLYWTFSNNFYTLYLR